MTTWTKAFPGEQPAYYWVRRSDTHHKMRVCHWSVAWDVWGWWDTDDTMMSHSGFVEDMEYWPVPVPTPEEQA